MSMGEERILSELPEPRTSSFKVALGVGAAAAGLAILLCGGVAGYVALTTADQRESEVSLASLSSDPSNIRERARKMITIDIPAGFEPLESEPSPMMIGVAFGRKGEPALLKLGSIERSAIPPGFDASQIAGKMLQMLEMGNPSAPSSSGLDPGSADTTGEFTVLGQPTTFRIVTGTKSPSETPVTKLGGVFRTRNAYVGLIYLIPTAEYNEGAFQELLDSIRPASGDGEPGDDGQADGPKAVANPQPDGDRTKKNGANSDAEAHQSDTPRARNLPDSP